MSTITIQLSHKYNEAGASLVALLAVMTVMAMFALAAAPSLQQQARRQREMESIARGEEIAEAIRTYVRYKGAFPSSMDQLLEGVPVPGRTTKLQILRPSAATDPLSRSGEWKLVMTNSQELFKFHRRVMTYNNGVLPQTSDHQLPVVNAVLISLVTNRIILDDETEHPTNDEDDSENATGQFIGVASRSRRASVLTYYGLAQHDRWVFTPMFR